MPDQLTRDSTSFTNSGSRWKNHERWAWLVATAGTVLISIWMLRANEPNMAADKRYSKEQLRELASQANQPISFFGKVIDQDQNPIPGVEVTFQIRYMKEIGPVGAGDTFDTPSVISGSDGRFSLTGARGSVLVVKSLEKAGYEPSEQATRGTYWYWRDRDPYRPDANSPEIFRMWKKAGAEKLIRKGIGHAIKYDGTPTTFDLLTGRVTNDGDLRITLMRRPEKINWGQKNYEWSVTIEILDGGLIASTDEQMYHAPAEGYQNKFVVRMPADHPQWTDKQVIDVYLKLRGGRCYGRARLELMVGAERPTTPLNITSYVNPSGSRNLEYEPLQSVGSTGP